MKSYELSVPGVIVIEPDVFGDHRGMFMETFRRDRYVELGMRLEFVQDNFSTSTKGTLRGLHYQLLHPQGKLVFVTRGEVFDVAVDIRRDSPTFGKWCGEILSDQNHKQMWVPPGFAHGFVVLSERALFTYLCTATYDRAADAAIRWDDPQLAIDWPVSAPLLSDKDACAPLIADVAPDRLPSIDG